MPPSARGRWEKVSKDVPLDPLTAAFHVCVTPILYSILALVHLCYYIYLMCTFSIQWRWTLLKGFRQTPQLLWQGWIASLGFQGAGITTAQQASEERLLERGNEVRTKGRIAIISSEGLNDLKKGKKQHCIAPRHVALSLASQHTRTRTLVYYALFANLKQYFESSKKSESLEEDNDLISDDEASQLLFAMQSIETCFRCCALAGVEEVTIYDEKGRVKRALKGKRELILELPLVTGQESLNKSIIENETAPRILNSPIPESIYTSAATTPGSFASANATPSISKRASSSSLQNAFINNKDRRDSSFFISATRSSRFKVLLRQSNTVEATVPTFLKGNSHAQEDYFCTLIVNLLGPEDAKGAIARAATAIVQDNKRPKVIDVKAIEAALQAQWYPSEPDLLIIHGGPRGVRTLHGFPPWLVRLCEIFQDVNASPYRPLQSISIEAAIISFTQSEQRYGR